MRSSSGYNRYLGRRVFQSFNAIVLGFVVFVCLFPFWNTVAVSFSGKEAVSAGMVGLVPVDPNVESYKAAFMQPLFFRSLFNSVLYTSANAVVNLVLTVMCAYPLSRFNRELPGRRAFMVFVLITMFFNGGLIPTYLLVNGLGMIDTIWAIIIPGSINQFTLIIVMTYFRSVPRELEDAAAIDGYRPIRVLIAIVVPISIPMITTAMLFNALWTWNNWFFPLIYLNSAEKYPLMLRLRNLVDSARVVVNNPAAGQARTPPRFVAESVKSAAIVIASAPMIVVYLFAQRYFIKGIMIGSLKG